MLVRWHNYTDEQGRCAEAQLFSPEAPTDKVILFCPGFPGAGATLFEQRHAENLTNEGFAVVVLRHAGTRFDSPFGPFMVNNGARLKQARDKGETMIGGVPAAIDTWLIEPLVALKTLAKNYAHIHVIGNSFGALSSLWSLTSDTAPLDNVKSLLLYAGAQGTSDGSPMDIMRIWQAQFIAMPRVTEKVSLEPAPQIAATLLNVYRDLPNRMVRIPVSVPITYLVVENDEILKPFDTQRFNDAIGGRGTIVMDSDDHAHPNAGLLAHDTPDYTTEKLLALIVKN